VRSLPVKYSLTTLQDSVVAAIQSNRAAKRTLAGAESLADDDPYVRKFIILPIYLSRPRFAKQLNLDLKRCLTSTSGELAGCE
jgi:hypothetical protein